MIVVRISIGRRHWVNNTDDVGPFPERWVLTPSKVLGKILRTSLTIFVVL